MNATLDLSSPMETERLLLRRYDAGDAEDLYEYLSDADVVKYEPYRPIVREKLPEELTFRMESDEMIAVVLKPCGKLIGNVYLGKRDFDTLELGYVFNRRYWGMGYAKESCKALLALSFSQGVHRVFAECDPLNTASWKLLESLGFVREAHHRRNVFFWKDEQNRPIWKDTYVYALLNPQRK